MIVAFSVLSQDTFLGISVTSAATDFKNISSSHALSTESLVDWIKFEIFHASFHYVLGTLLCNNYAFHSYFLDINNCFGF